jgi:putative endonuclease
MATSNRQRLDFLQEAWAHAARYAEEHASIYEAISREKAMKAWNRNWKLRQIMDTNPEWQDLFETINH